MHIFLKYLKKLFFFRFYIAISILEDKQYIKLKGIFLLKKNYIFITIIIHNNIYRLMVF